MSSDVFICYDPSDEKVARDICNILENSNNQCWFKKRDFAEDDSVYNITEAIRSSKSFVLIFSKDAKKSNFVTTEIDIAFSENIPIIVFKIDDSEIEGKQQFYLKDKPIINAYPKTNEYYDELNNDISKVVGSSGVKHSGQNDVYICYSEEDVLTAEAICHVLEENGIKCWLKKRDFSVNDTNEKIIDTIEKSKSFILVYSDDAINSNYVKSETNFCPFGQCPNFIL